MRALTYWDVKWFFHVHTTQKCQKQGLNLGYLASLYMDHVSVICFVNVRVCMCLYLVAWLCCSVTFQIAFRPSNWSAKILYLFEFFLEFSNNSSFIKLLLGLQSLLSTYRVNPWAVMGLGVPTLCVVENSHITYTGPSVCAWFLGISFLYIYGINNCRSCSTMVFTIKKDSQINRPLYFICVTQASTIFHLLSASMTWMRLFFKKIYNWGIWSSRRLDNWLKVTE